MFGVEGLLVNVIKKPAYIIDPLLDLASLPRYTQDCPTQQKMGHAQIFENYQ